MSGKIATPSAACAARADSSGYGLSTLAQSGVLSLESGETRRRPFSSGHLPPDSRLSTHASPLIRRSTKTVFFSGGLPRAESRGLPRAESRGLPRAESKALPSEALAFGCQAKEGAGDRLDFAHRRRFDYAQGNVSKTQSRVPPSWGGSTHLTAEADCPIHGEPGQRLGFARGSLPRLRENIVTIFSQRDSEIIELFWIHLF